MKKCVVTKDSILKGQRPVFVLKGDEKDQAKPASSENAESA